MAERKIHAKFNVHKTYKKMIFINPYRDVESGGVYNFGKALNFDGVDDYCVFPSIITSNILTVSTWFKLKDSNNQRFFGGDETTEWIDIRPSTSIINIRFNAGGQNFNVGNIPIGSWNHLLFADSGNGARVFLNGVQSSTGNVVLANNYAYKYLGRQSTYSVSNIILDDVLITDTYGNPQSEASAIYSGADPLTVIPTAKHLYRMNGNGNNDGVLGGALTLNNFIPDSYVTH